MSGHHPDPQILERFMRNEAGAQERRAVVLHLLTGCPQCVARTRRLWNLGESPPEAGESGSAAAAAADHGRGLDEDREPALAAAPASTEAAAEHAFREAMRESLLAGHAREAARALLELALLYARQDRSEDLQRLAEELRPICLVPGVGMSVTMALLFFRRLVETGYATQDVLFEVAHFLDPPKAQRAGGV